MENRKLYRSPYEAYPFLADEAEDYRCDFELLTDYVASQIGLLRCAVIDTEIREELRKICELVYHMNPSLRTFVSITQDEVEWLYGRTEELKRKTDGRCRQFVLTQGGESACRAHTLRVLGKGIVRFLYRYEQQGHPVPPILYDFANLLSGYFFYLALECNRLEGIEEIPYISRNY